MKGRHKAKLLTAREREAALAFLSREARQNLLLMDMVAGVGEPASPTELPPRVVAVWRDGEMVGVASLRPSVVLDFGMTPEILESCLPLVASVESGLIKSARHVVTPMWEQLLRRGRHALIDRGEIAYQVTADCWKSVATKPVEAASFRAAKKDDHEALVFAARASLREEGRPDPFDGDPVGFRNWVRGRVRRARVIEADGRVVFVGYADVRRSEGWLIQGVYTWPEDRRRGYAALGMRGLIEEAVASGADHVQLAVVEGNTAAIRLYEHLGFQPFSQLRTIIFL